MSATRTDVDDADRLARVTLGRTIESGDLRVTGLVSELGADKGLSYLRGGPPTSSPTAASRSPRSSVASDPVQVLEQTPRRSSPTSPPVGGSGCAGR